MFLSNKYSSWYFNIINNAKNRNLKRKTSAVYIECHHIIPKSIGGTDNHSNLVYLTAKEHYICHLLLPKFTINKDRQKMLYAFLCMNRRSKNNPNMKRYKGNSRLYEIYKIKLKELRKHVPGPNKGKKFSTETKNKMSIIKIGKKFSDYHKTKLSYSQKQRYIKKGKGYCCLNCNKIFPGSNPSKHFNLCYSLP